MSQTAATSRSTTSRARPRESLRCFEFHEEEQAFPSQSRQSLTLARVAAQRRKTHQYVPTRRRTKSAPESNPLNLPVISTIPLATRSNPFRLPPVQSASLDNASPIDKRTIDLEPILELDATGTSLYNQSEEEGISIVARIETQKHNAWPKSKASDRAGFHSQQNTAARSYRSNQVNQVPTKPILRHGIINPRSGFSPLRNPNSAFSALPNMRLFVAATGARFQLDDSLRVRGSASPVKTSPTRFATPKNSPDHLVSALKRTDSTKSPPPKLSLEISDFVADTKPKHNVEFSDVAPETKAHPPKQGVEISDGLANTKSPPPRQSVEVSDVAPGNETPQPKQSVEISDVAPDTTADPEPKLSDVDNGFEITIIPPSRPSSTERHPGGSLTESARIHSQASSEINKINSEIKDLAHDLADLTNA